jgi:signal transduction histidine kinase
MNVTLDPLVAAAIHDTKNALLAIDTQLEEAARRPASADFGKVRGGVARIAARLSELLTLYRAQNGQLRLAIDDHDLSDFIDDLLAELGPPPEGITLEVDRAVATRIGAWAFDAYLVKLALLDALRNCLRHANRRVTLALSAPPEGGICFAVGDDGPGFPPDLLAGGEPLQSAKGTGLGLSFVRLIAERHATPAGKRGRVELVNADGAVTRLILP